MDRLLRTCACVVAITGLLACAGHDKSQPAALSGTARDAAVADGGELDAAELPGKLPRVDAGVASHEPAVVSAGSDAVSGTGAGMSGTGGASGIGFAAGSGGVGGDEQGGVGGARPPTAGALVPIAGRSGPVGGGVGPVAGVIGPVGGEQF